MMDVAAASHAVFGVGHTERYNPAVEAVRPLVDHPRFIEVHRLGTFPDRSLDIDVVFDLMIHDLDVVLSIVAVRGDRRGGSWRCRVDAESRTSPTRG